MTRSFVAIVSLLCRVHLPMSLGCPPFTGSLDLSAISIDVLDDAIDRCAVFFDKQFVRRVSGRAPFLASTKATGRASALSQSSADAGANGR